jgi:molecular chaperone GrpE (heat shock protein)
MAADPATPEEVRALALEVVRALAADRRASARDKAAADDDLARVVRSAVEALEAVAETTAALLPLVPEAARGALELAARGAWERLESAGIERDGAVGEALDLARHRVVRARPAGGAAPGTVVDVLAPGIVFRGRRVREAAVAVSAEGGRGSRRD